MCDAKMIDDSIHKFNDSMILFIDYLSNRLDKVSSKVYYFAYSINNYFKYKYSKSKRGYYKNSYHNNYNYNYTYPRSKSLPSIYSIENIIYTSIEDTEDTVPTIPSITRALLLPKEFVSEGAGNVKLAELFATSKMVELLNVNELEAT